MCNDGEGLWEMLGRGNGEEDQSSCTCLSGQALQRAWSLAQSMHRISECSTTLTRTKGMERKEEGYARDRGRERVKLVGHHKRES